MKMPSWASMPEISNATLMKFQGLTMVGTTLIDGFKLGLTLKTEHDTYLINEKNAHNSLPKQIEL